MKPKDFFKVGKLFGNQGGIKPLSLDDNTISWLSKVCSEFITAINECESHSLYRCVIHSEEDSVLFIDLLGSNEDGNMVCLQLIYDITTGERIIPYKDKIRIPNESSVWEGIYNLLVGLSENTDKPIGMLDIPLVGKFYKGILLPYVNEAGTDLISIESFADSNVFMEF